MQAERNSRMLNRRRNIFILLTSLTVFSFAVFGQLKKGNYRPAELGAIQQAGTQELSPDSVYEVPPYPVPTLELAAGDGRAEVQIFCNTCHSPRYISMQPPLSGEAWEAEVNKMDKTFGANIPQDSKQKIIRYLQQHYTPETRQQ